MDIVLPKPGTYVLAVSGGVDSRVLLDIMHKQSRENNTWKLVVAHLDHDIRTNSSDDRKFVQMTAKEYGLPFVYQSAHLGKNASEAYARAERYKFLHHVKQASNAQAVITAHHQNDLLETAIINILRGSKRKGLTALRSHDQLLRPLLNVPKSELIQYAKDQGLTWQEDSTNNEDVYVRNYLRHNVLPRLDEQATAQLLTIINKLQSVNSTLDTLLVKQLQQQDTPGTLSRTWFNGLPHTVAREILATWLRTAGLRDFDTKTLELLVVHAKTAQAGSRFPLRSSYVMRVTKDHLALEPTER
jgi:tRNA(Ile)-lysidine synthetase-like protein